MPKECEWTKQICDEMTKSGAIVAPLVASGAQNSLPDRLVVHRDWSGLLEFKGEKTILRLNQAIMIRNMVSRDPDFVYIVRFPDLIQLPCTQVVNVDGYYTVARFDGTGLGLLKALKLLRESVESAAFQGLIGR